VFVRIVAFSDSHNNFGALHRVVDSQPGAEVFLYLGDGWREFEDLRDVFPDKRMLSVRGNCDWGSAAKDEDILICGGKRIFFTHGHQYDVRRGPQRIILRAKELCCDIAMFGHTHISAGDYVDGVYLLNPGSVTEPRGGSVPSYGVIDITSAGIVVNIVPL